MLQIIALGTILTLSSCASTMRATALKKAAFDLDCPSNQIELIELGLRSYGAKGCEKRISYVIQGECSIESSCRAMKDVQGIE
jgi:hypothetical protein